MPGFVIHIAIGKEYIKKHKNEVKNTEEFFKGILAPDLISLLNKNISKDITHYGKWNFIDLEIHLDKFLKDENVDLSKDYWKGYFIHLLTDYNFYLKAFKEETSEVIKNNDNYYYYYDCLNKVLIEKYHIYNITDENITKYMKYTEGEPKYLRADKVIQFITDLSNICIEEKIKIENK